MNTIYQNKSAIAFSLVVILFLAVALRFVSAAEPSREAILKARISFLMTHIHAEENNKLLYIQEIKNIEDQVTEWSREIEGHEYELTEALGK